MVFIATMSAGEGSIEVLGRNLAALAIHSPAAARAVRAAGARDGLILADAPDGGLTGTLETEGGGGPRQLASKRAPLAEGEAFARSVDLLAAAAVVVRGFGVGHHVAALARRAGRHGVVLVFEPDAALLRAVLERVDCTAWLALGNVRLIVDGDDTGAIAGAAAGVEALLATGTKIVDHAPSTARLGAASERFAANFADVMKAVRTTVVTTLVQVEITVRNLLGNLRWYARAPGIADLEGACKGRPAIVVSAGPSLARNIELLSEPGVRDRFVIVAVQTVLKQLLARGVRPHFVTALDYHAISKRFYEGLTARDVEGVTLVAEAKVSPAVLKAFPGAVRLVGDEILDGVLGAGLARPMGKVEPGATVAHLAYFLARYLGCEPVVLMGQDLGFTDGQYYAAGAAIHQVWAGELNEFLSLEALEWQRIMRMRGLLRRGKDHLGRPCYSDEQMATYLVQFEQAFSKDAAKGLTIIDATEGGMAKRHARVMTLREAIDTNGGAEAKGWVDAAPAMQDESRLAAVERRLSELRRSAGRIGLHAEKAAGLLEEMRSALERGDVAASDRVVERVTAVGREAQKEEAFWLVDHINQTGQLRRFQADRAMELKGATSPAERQRAQVERDLSNVKWLGEASQRVAEILDGAGAALTRDDAGADESTVERAAATVEVGAGANERAGDEALWAIVLADAGYCGLNTARALARNFIRKPAIAWTVERLARARRVAGVVIVSDDVEAARASLGEAPPGLRVEFEACEGAELKAWRSAMGPARLWARQCWRGGLGNASIYDEAVPPRVMAPVMARRGLKAAVFVGADWALVDPALVDGVIARYAERPESNELTFVQAPPGLGACVLSKRVMAEFARVGGPFATVGALLGYIPAAPQADPIAKPACVTVAPHVRDLLARVIPDSPHRARELSLALGGLCNGGSENLLNADAEAIARWLTRHGRHAQGSAFAPGLEHVAIDVSTPEAWALSEAGIDRLSAWAAQGEVALTLRVGVDPLAQREWMTLARRARGMGFAGVHLRTAMACDAERAVELLDPELGLDVISVDLATWEHATAQACGFPGGVAGHERAVAAVRALVERRGMGLERPWIVPRIERCDAVYAEIEPFYDRWLLACGAACIDPMRGARAGERIAPLPRPERVALRERHSARVVDVDGRVTDGAGEVVESGGAATGREQGAVMA